MRNAGPPHSTILEVIVGDKRAIAGILMSPMSARPPPTASDGAAAERVMHLPTSDSIDLKEAKRSRTDVSDAAI